MRDDQASMRARDATRRLASARCALAAGTTVLASLTLAPAAFAITVNDATDAVVANDGKCTLPEAIAAANSNAVSGPTPGECSAGLAAPTRDGISFSIAGAATPASPHTIVVDDLPAGLPAFSEPIWIDGTTEPDYAGTPIVEIRDQSAAPAALVVGATADSSVIDGLSVSQAGGDAIRILADSTTIRSNYIGIRPNRSAGSVAGSGIRISGDDNKVGVVGAFNAAHSNRIAENGDDGITIEAAGVRNSVAANSIGPNGGSAGDLAIDLGADGFDVNDPGDGDAGPNDGQNYPEITAAVPALSLVRGTFEAAPGSYRIEVFASSSRGPAGGNAAVPDANEQFTGIAERFLARSGVINVDQSGEASWDVFLPRSTIEEGDWITATAIRQGGAGGLLDTSEVSLPLAARTCDIEGSPGNDTLVGTSANEVICADAGNDVVQGGGGTDYLLGGEGNDTLRGGTGLDHLFGQEGIDTADYSDATSNVNADLADGLAAQDGNGAANETLAAIENLTGGPDADTLGGDNLANVINGGNGDDVINSSGGDDVVNAGIGDDAMNGGDGNDRELGGAGLDIISGGNGDDVLFGGTENDSIDGAAGNDSLLGEQGNDTLAGLEGEDLILGSIGNDRLEGGGANDLLNGGPGTDRVDGDRGNDAMQGQGGNDLMNGGQGKDRMTAGVGNDRLLGAGASDRMRGGKGNDFLNGGGGTDKLFGDDGRDRFVGGKGKDLCDGGADRDKRNSPGCVTRRSIP